jgi:hypothetical protein
MEGIGQIEEQPLVADQLAKVAGCYSTSAAQGALPV